MAVLDIVVLSFRTLLAPAKHADFHVVVPGASSPSVPHRCILGRQAGYAATSASSNPAMTKNLLRLNIPLTCLPQQCPRAGTHVPESR